MLRRTLVAVAFVLGVFNSPLWGQPGQPKQLANAIQEAQALIAQQRFVAAETKMQQATKQFSTRPAAWYFLGYTKHAQKKYDEAMEAYRRADQLSQGKANAALYNMACIHAIRGEKEQAFEHLDKAIKSGFSNLGHIQSDSELANLREDDRFQNYQPKWVGRRKTFCRANEDHP